MLDSGAFSVWNKGATINLEAYTDFCLRHKNVSAYVSLDVIPGKANDVRSLSRTGMEESCARGWANYQYMLKAGVPFNKLVPVYHQGDSVAWLKKYLDFGTPYLGISPANDRTTDQKINWLRDIRPLLFDGDNTPTVKTHGFAVTSFRLMKFMAWYSVDSASWKMSAAMGGAYIPRQTNGEDDYSKPPLLVGLSPMSPTRFERGSHIDTMSPLLKRRVDETLEKVGVSMGKWEIVPAKGKVEKGKEFWFDKKKGTKLRVLEDGCGPNWEHRAAVNAYFMRQANKVLPIKHIYFAGAPRKMIEHFLNRRLLTYHDIRGERGLVYSLFVAHSEMVKNKTPVVSGVPECE